jgi:hypothetical protein
MTVSRILNAHQKVRKSKFEWQKQADWRCTDKYAEGLGSVCILAAFEKTDS